MWSTTFLDEEGRSHFELLRYRTRREKDHLVYYVFDLLYLDGRDLRGLPLLRRKEILKDLIERTAPPGVQYSDYVEEKGEAFFEVASQRGLEGIGGKDAASPYISRSRTDCWVKFKNCRIEQVYIGGFVDSLKHVESLLLGVFKDNQLLYVGNTDRGLSRGNIRQQLQQQLSKLIRHAQPIGLNPSSLVESAFLEWTQDGRLRHSTLVGLD